MRRRFYNIEDQCEDGPYSVQEDIFIQDMIGNGIGVSGFTAIVGGIFPDIMIRYINECERTDMSYMFSMVYNVTTIPDIGIVSGTRPLTCDYMFSNSVSLTSIGHLDLMDCASYDNILGSRYSTLDKLKTVGFVNVGGGGNAISRIDLGGFINWDRDNMIRVLRDDSFDRRTAGMRDLPIYLNSNAFGLITDDEKVSIGNKGFTLNIS